MELLISEEHPIRYRKDFEARLDLLETHSGQEVSGALRETYDEIFQRNTQGEHSYKLAKKTLNIVLCAFRPLAFKELCNAVAIDEDSNVTPVLIKSICSNFVVVDTQAIARFAHFSVKEYLEAKLVDGVPEFPIREAHLQAAVTCLRVCADPTGYYWDFSRSGRTLAQFENANWNLFGENPERKTIGRYAFHYWFIHWAKYKLESGSWLDGLSSRYLDALASEFSDLEDLPEILPWVRSTLGEVTMGPGSRLRRRPLLMDHSNLPDHNRLRLSLLRTPGNENPLAACITLAAN